MNAEERDTEIARKQDEIKTLRKTLHELSMQKAKFSIYAPVYIQTQIDETQESIEKAEKEIERLRSAPVEPDAQPTAAAAKSALPIDKTTLRRRMLDSYDLERLEILCSDINTQLQQAGSAVKVGPEIVGGRSLEAIIKNLIDYLDRRGLLDVLLEALRSDQPGIV